MPTNNLVMGFTVAYVASVFPVWREVSSLERNTNLNLINELIIDQLCLNLQETQLFIAANIVVKDLLLSV